MYNPIFIWEMAPARRAGLWKLRWAFVLLLLVEMVLCIVGALSEQSARFSRFEWQDRHGVLWRYYQLFCGQHVVALVFITPLLSAGALAREKSMGTFELLLTTELTSSDIVLGKLAAQVLQVTLWTAPTWPIVALLHGFLGLPGWSLAIWLMSLVAFSAVLVCVSLFCSAVLRTSASALIVSYGATGLLLAGLEGFSDLGDRQPWNADGMLRSYRSPSVWILLAIGMLALTILCSGLRRLYRWTLDREHSSRRVERSRDHPPLCDEPIFWRQRWLGSTCQLPLLHRLSHGSTLFLGLVPACCVPFVMEPTFGWCVTHAFAMVAGFAFVAAVRGSATISGERERQTWDCLQRTPLASFEIVWQHFQGIRDRLDGAWLLYAVVVLVWCVRALAVYGNIQGLLNSAVLVVAWVIALPALRAGVASGLHSSAKSPTIWQSLIPALFAVSGQLLQIAFIAVMFSAVLVAGTMMLGVLGLMLFFVLIAAFALVANRTLSRYAEADLNMATRILKEMERRLHVPDWGRAQRTMYNRPHAVTAKNEIE